MGSYWVRVGPKSNDWCPVGRERFVNTVMETHREGHVTTETLKWEHLQAKGHQGLPAATRTEERGLEQTVPQSLHKEPHLLTP